jgi:hypothetical protein
MNVIDRSIEFLTALDPEVPRALQGSTPEQIASLTAAMGREPTPVHRAFLERMGESQGLLTLGLYGFSPAQLMSHRPHLLPRASADLSLFAVPLDEDVEQIYLLDGDDPELVRSAGYPRGEDGRLDLEEAEPAAGSLSELLCLPFLNARVVAPKPHQATYAEKERRDDTLARCRHLAALFGFEPYWFSNASTYAAHRGSLVLVAKQARGYLFSCGLAGNDAQDFGVVFRTLTRELDLAIFR